MHQKKKCHRKIGAFGLGFLPGGWIIRDNPVNKRTTYGYEATILASYGRYEMIQTFRITDG